MTSRSIVSPEGQSATFIELFFDLVFVFSVTQVVRLFHHGIHWDVVGQSVLVFWIVWWAWTQFTWALNAADTTHPMIDLGVLVATGVAFFMAVALPDAFHGATWSFTVPYVVVRIIGLAIYVWVACADPAHRSAVTTFGLLSVAGMIAVLWGGYLGGTAQYWVWFLAILFDVLAAAIGGRLEGWTIQPEHFGERHGLIVIIALGETLIVAAGGFAGELRGGALIAVAVLAVATTCSVWWIYFARAQGSLEHALHAVTGSARSSMARDVFSLGHFPILCGVIAYAVAIEEGVVHPDAPLALAARCALASSIFLFSGGMGLAVWRATSRVLWFRMGTSVGIAGVIVGLGGIPAWGSFAIVFVGASLVALVEQGYESYP